jgi:hypothetical protein
VTDNFGLNGSQEQKNRDIDGSNEEDDDDDGLLVGSDEEDGGYENDAIFVDGEDVMPGYEHLFVVLCIIKDTWLNLSAILTEN